MNEEIAGTGIYEADIDSGFGDFFTNSIVNELEITSPVGFNTLTHELIQRVYEN